MSELDQDGRMIQAPPPAKWDHWTELDGSAWPEKKERAFQLIPTVCFNCESACGLLSYVDKETLDIKKFEGNPLHPGSRGRTCAKGPATHNQINDPNRILYPLKRKGKRGAGEWERISWDQAIDEIGQKMGDSRRERRDGITYHVGRPGEDHYTNRCIKAWGVDAHNSHTNICSASARLGYSLWAGFDRPSPDHANANVILLISAHLESGHYFNPHAQRIMEGKERGAKIITLDPRLSNTASKSDLWLSCWPGSETLILLSIANYLIQNNFYDRKFFEANVNWEDFYKYFTGTDTKFSRELEELKSSLDSCSMYNVDRILKSLYSEFTFERAAKEARVSEESIRAAADIIAACEGKLAAHSWRAAAIGNLGGWQVARCLFFLNVLTGSVGVKGGTQGNSWNKFTPKPFITPPDLEVWNELHFPLEWPLAHFEMSFILPQFLAEKRGVIDVYFTRVYNPVATNPDGFSWIRALTDEEQVKCHVALTPTWNETAQYADYVLPMGHASERHDLMSQETHASKWIAFRQPVRRVAMETAGKKVKFTHEANVGEVWEENEFWVEVSGRMDPDGSLGIRKYFESPYREGELVTQDEYHQWIFENSIPGLPEKAKAESLSPLAYMKKYGVFEIEKNQFPFEKADTFKFGTPSGKLELFSSTMRDWGWPELEHVLPWYLKSHVHPDHIDSNKGEMLLLPNFRLPTLIHTRSANAKWLYELSHQNPVWIHTSDANRIGVVTGSLIKVETQIGYFVDKVWVTEGIKPGIVACSHHLGRWRLKDNNEIGPGMSNLVDLTFDNEGNGKMSIKEGPRSWKTVDPDTSRIWWKNAGVHQNLTFGVQPDPISGAHCWLQKAVSVSKATETDQYGDVYVEKAKSDKMYEEWYALTRSATKHSPDGTRRPYWLKRPLKPTKEAYRL